jgi:hypothetical protein
MSRLARTISHGSTIKRKSGYGTQPEEKNRTDNRQTPPLVPLRYLLAFVPVVTPVRHFSESAVRRLHRTRRDRARAWTKAVPLHVTLWTRPSAATASGSFRIYALRPQSRSLAAHGGSVSPHGAESVMEVTAQNQSFELPADCRRHAAAVDTCEKGK